MFSARFRFSVLVALLVATPAHAEHLFESNFLTQAVVAPFAFFPDFALVGDLNGDGLRDLYLAPHGGGLGEVALGLGDGTFAPCFLSNLNDSTNKFGALLLDLNRDGKADLIEQRQTSGSPLKVSIGLGNGNFAPPVYYGAPPQPETYYSLFGGDLDGDGWTDIVYAIDDTVVVWRNHGDGTLEAPIVIPVDLFVFGLFDVDGDGKLDLWGEQISTGRLAVALGLGNGSFGPVIASALGSLRAMGSAMGDLDGDGKPDLLGFTSDGSASQIFFGDGAGAFVAGPSPALRGEWDGIADLNGDGRNEGVGLDYYTNLTVVQAVNPDRTLPPASSIPAPVNISGWTGFNDLNGDGRPDIVCTANTSAEYSVALAGAGAPLPVVPEFATGSRPMEVAVGDLNGDGHLDVVTANAADGTISVLLGNGAGGLSPHTDFAAGQRPVALVLADLDGDGKLDVAAADSTGNAVQVLLGNGAGGFGPPTPFAAGSGPNGLAVGDLNHDGKLDLIVVDRSANTLAELLGTGGGAFASPAITPLAAPSFKVALGDLDGDGVLDAAVIGGPGSSSLVYLFHGVGNGGFTSAGSYQVSNSAARDIAIADLNGDGKQDVIAESRGALGTFLGNGDGTLGPIHGQIARGAFGIAVADLDGDGNRDVVAASDLVGFPTPPFSGGAAFFHGLGNGSMGQFVAYGSDGMPNGLALGDMNGDGSPDIVIANTTVSTVSVLLHEVNGPVPALASIVSAEGLTDRVRLVWQGAPYFAASLYRQVAPGSWTLVAPVVADASGRITYEDRNVVAGQSYSYRLGANVGPGEIFFGDVTVRTPTGATLALAGASPNPAHGVWSVAFSLPGTGPARLEVIDLAGRVVAQREVGRFGEGSHVLALPETAGVPAGVYFLRLTRGAQTQIAKVCAIR
jgi:hypothetical protein